ncbi:RNA-directed DNA polymerase [Melia azedarach]|uniref:RNA-directed DNA polymerase n=1 Tax=Melia azedarach TaxID=155640 RepID=A0ACC1XHA3_MELAZ|nr:RNA-directed DNA polymerase [Melia azedarach]
MMNRSTGKTLFEIVYLQPPHHTLDLMTLPSLSGISKAAENLVKKVYKIQKKVRANLEAANKKYKQGANQHQRQKIFQEGDIVMAYLQKNQFLGIYSKCRTNSMVHFELQGRLMIMLMCYSY